MAAERKRLESAQALLFFKIKDAYLMALTSEKLADLYASATIPQATLTLESGIAAYETGGIDFLMLLDDLKTLFTYELGYYEQLANLEKAIAMLEQDGFVKFGDGVCCGSGDTGGTSTGDSNPGMHRHSAKSSKPAGGSADCSTSTAAAF